MAVITACYLSAGGSDNMLGSAWTAVRQLQSEDINNVLECTSTGTDRDVEKQLKRKGIHQRKIGLILSEDKDSRIGVVPHSKGA